ncbi:molybdopterin-guanine dinucleotide biosynthesis protein A [Thermocatellispora tengchongensis]|uniref:Molybdopterin-guanine dinucleotide biosynthesis protein A n=1 Tax=Thermocatellispora tengchongensis TaxID=1073253 RepID=A0A840PIH4_9ACTN|nr:NTP transferase domain-containing protein [Thermocatellispora tengchongensis]MBB5135875.1 molybdopterin-guanine dinucleotide biosynthesis protein A [Thermocatellispora tengchongensis]
MRSFDAVVLAGGRAERLGGRDKPGLRVGGAALVERVVAAVRGARTVVVVGPARGGLPAGVVFAREEPPGGGPVPALRAGLAALAESPAPWVALLAGDLPFLRPEHVAVLAGAAARNGAGAVLEDDERRPQWLVGVWSRGRLSVALEAYQGRSLRGLLGPLGPALVRLEPGAAGTPPWFDCDTMDDLRLARGLAGTGPAGEAGGAGTEGAQPHERA